MVSLLLCTRPVQVVVPEDRAGEWILFTIWDDFLLNRCRRCGKLCPAETLDNALSPCRERLVVIDIAVYPLI